MKLSILAAREQMALESITSQLAEYGIELDFNGLKGDARHKHMFMLERIAEGLKNLQIPSLDTDAMQTAVIENVLSIDGLTKSSANAIKAHYGITD